MVWGWIYTDVEFIRYSFIYFSSWQSAHHPFLVFGVCAHTPKSICTIAWKSLRDKQIHRGLHTHAPTHTHTHTQPHSLCQTFCLFFPSVEYQRQFMHLPYWRTMSAITSTIRQSANAMYVASIHFAPQMIIKWSLQEAWRRDTRYTMKYKRCMFSAKAGERII